MSQQLSLVSVVVCGYDDAIAFYCGILGFELVEDIDQPDQNKRRVVVRPKGGGDRQSNRTRVPVFANR